MSEDYATNRSERVVEEIHLIARRLRKLADDIEREAEIGKNIRTMRLDHGKTASEVVHKATWGVANLHLDALVSMASEADAACRDAEVSS